MNRFDMMKNKTYSLFRNLAVFAMALLLVSCGGARKFVYLSDMAPGERYDVNLESATIIHSNDRLDIKVSCKNPELAVPFNAQMGSYQISADGSVNSAGVEVNAGYRVDDEGNIVFPVLGKINVGGKTLKEVSETIETMIEEGGYIKSPEVSIEFLNFKYTVLGAVNGKGTYTVDGDKVTIIEAIAKAGDLAKNARLDRIAVIRMVDGKQEIYYNDIRTADIFKSPTYFLQQNDIVYVEPKHKERNENAWQTASFFVSLGSIVSTILLVLSSTGVIGG
jgi:polysaccharide export outer membrane protein